MLRQRFFDRPSVLEQRFQVSRGSPRPWSLALSAPNQRALHSRARSIQKDPHAQRFGALCRHQSHLPADMIDVFDAGDLALVVLGIPFQTRNPLLHRLAELRTDFETFLGTALDGHPSHLGVGEF
jgi:hypothetical protein